MLAPTSRFRLIRLRSLSIAICLLVLLTRCAVASTPTPEPVVDDSATVGCQVKIGIITSLSGEFENRAAELVQGYDLARDDINAAGGILGCQLELIYRDDASLSTEAANALQTLVETDEVLIVAGSIASVITLDLVPLASEYRIPLLAHNSTNSLITDLGYEWVFRTMPSSWSSLDQMIRYISTLDLSDIPSVALLYEDSSFGQDAYVTLLSRLKAYGISLVAALPIPSEADEFPPLLERVAASGASMLFLAGSSVSEGMNIMQQIETADLNFAAYLTPGGAYNSAEFVQSPYANYMISPVPWTHTISLTDEMSGQTTSEFLTRFSQHYGNEPTFRTVNAYVNIYVAKTAIETALTAPPEGEIRLEQARRAIRDALRELHLDQTLFGPIDFDEFGQNATALMMTQIIDGQFVTISPDTLATSNVLIPAPTWAERGSS